MVQAVGIQLCCLERKNQWVENGGVGVGEVGARGQRAKDYTAVFWSSSKNYDYEWEKKTARNERKGKVACFKLSNGNQNNNIQSSQIIFHVLRNWNLCPLTKVDDKDLKEIQIFFFNWILFCCLL